MGNGIIHMKLSRNCSRMTTGTFKGTVSHDCDDLLLVWIKRNLFRELLNFFKLKMFCPSDMLRKGCVLIC